MKIISIRLFLFLLLIAVSCTNKQKNKKLVESNLPNIILLMGDDHGWDEVGYNGHPFVKTPILDEMAASGLRFDRFYSGHSSCSPTRGSFITGRHPNRYGTFTPGWSIRPEEFSIAQLVKKAGYSTAHFGKWHLGPVKQSSPTNPRAMGFDEYLSHDNFFELNPILSRNGAEPQVYKGESSKILIDETIKFIKKASKTKKPFMTVVWFGSPHEPYSGLPEDLALYNNLPDSLNDRKVGLTSNETGQKVTRPLRDVLQERYAEITAMDRAIGDLRTYLKENGLMHNTIVWYCGDNGTPPSAGRTGMTIRAQKGSMYEGGILVPGVMEWPAAIKEPKSTNAVSVTSDFLPTLAELTGQNVPERPLDGISLVPFFNAPEKEREEPLYFWSFNNKKAFENGFEDYIEPKLQEGTTPLVKMMGGKYTRNFRNYKYVKIEEAHFSGERAMMLGDYKLLVPGNSSKTNNFELYNLKNDRAEKNNLANKLPEKVEDMSKQMRMWQESVLQSLTGADY